MQNPSTNSSLYNNSKYGTEACCQFSMSESHDGPFLPPTPPQTQPQQVRVGTENTRQAQIVSSPITTREADPVLRNLTQDRFVPFQPQEEGRSQQARRSTGPQDDGSRAVREAARQRLAEQRRCEREATRQREWLAERMQREREAMSQRETVRWMKEEERRHQETETIRRQEEERCRQQAKSVLLDPVTCASRISANAMIRDIRNFARRLRSSPVAAAQLPNCIRFAFRVGT